jgi:hypothetical protein
VNSRSLHYAPPDFLWNLVALMHFMRPSLRKGAHVDLSSAAWQEIQVRSGRDDTSVWALRFERENSGGPRGALQIPPLRYAPVGMTPLWG